LRSATIVHRSAGAGVPIRRPELRTPWLCLRAIDNNGGVQLTRAEVASSLSRFTRISASVADHRAAAVAVTVVLDGNVILPSC
jgi:hypothetical protein